MGFDMYIEERDGLTEDQVYFRLNIGGMGHCQEIMVVYDMLVVVDSPRWPRPEEFGCEIGKNEEGWMVYDESSPQWADYAKAAIKVRDGHCDKEQPGIPIFKLSTNDGWLVTPLEIEGALAMHDKKVLDLDWEPQPEWWHDWLRYLKLAKGHGGFRVH